MLPVLNADEMRLADENTIKYFKMPQLVLMERAALETKRMTLEQYHKQLSDDAKILIVAGKGNNGGDGVALARLFHLAGYDVTVFISPERDRFSDALKKQVEIADVYKLRIESDFETIQNQKYTLIVDALFGIGLSRQLSDEYQRIITILNEMSGIKVALDIPSGLCADDGHVFGTVFHADMTITFGFLKTGLLLYPGKAYCGNVIVADIGIDKASFREMSPNGFTYPKNLKMTDIFPKRMDNSHKGTYGKVLLVAGSEAAPGAALLAGKSILKTGAGMLKVLTPLCNKELLLSALPEAMFAASEHTDMKEALTWCDQLVIGPGLGTSEDAKNLFINIVKLLQEEFTSFEPMKTARLSIVIDADGLNLMAEHEDLFKHLRTLATRVPIILTPHMAELARLMKISVKELSDNRLELLNTFCQKTGCIVVSKDAATLVGMYSNAFRFYVNQTGNNGMATAGSGDVLAGITGAVLAGIKNKTFENCFDGTVHAVYSHGLAGDMAADKIGKASMLAGDIIEQLPILLKEL
ncbi:MAG: NAD(P)H-hydrate dehydratase [Lachnospiraceae bacterium]|nr:NAD(P)H-hydrate dehydratase [Lachnospiraceae bacterium]